MRYRYSALGLDIVAPFACPGFWPAEAAMTGRSIEIVLGCVPARLADPLRERPLLQIDAAGTALFHVPGVARYLMRARTEITIALEPGAALDRALDFLKGTPLALLCHQWGLVPLEAACLAREDRAMLFGCGPGCGKSSLALALAAHGFRLLADGLCALEPRADGPPWIWPSFPEVRVWRDTLEALGHPLPPGDPGPGFRYRLDAEAWFEPAPRPALAIAALHSARGGIAAQVSRRRGASAFEAVMNLQALADAMRGLAPRGADPMLAIGRLVAETPVYEVWYPSGLERLAALPHWLMPRLGLPAAPAAAAAAVAAAATVPAAKRDPLEVAACG